MPADCAGGFRHARSNEEQPVASTATREKQCGGADDDFHSCFNKFLKATRHRIAREARVYDFTAATAELGRVRRIEEQSFESIGERAGVTGWA